MKELIGVLVGDRVKFSEEKSAYTVQARNERYLICTKPFNPKRTVIYSIVDLMEGIRGPDNMIFGMGYESRRDCEERLADLMNEESMVEVSWRKRCPANVEAVIPHVIKPGARYLEPEENLSVRVTSIDTSRVYYEGDAEGFATINEFRKAYVAVPRVREIQ
jgi:hypothetical protein